MGEDLALSGKVRAIAVSGPKRLPKFPDVPTFAEAGFSEASYEAWFGLLVPAGVPADILAKLNRDIADVMAISFSSMDRFWNITAVLPGKHQDQ